MAVLKGIDVIRRWVIQTRLKEQTKQGGVMITLPKKEFVDLNTSITADRLLRSGIDIDQLTTVGQVDNLINQINKRSVISQGDPRFEGIMNQLMGKKGEVVDMRGQKIPPGSKIMGGQAVDDLPPPGSRGGPDDIAAPVQSAEEATTNLANSTVMKITSMEPVAALKEANKVIKREGIYKALSKEQASKILKDSEDWIFQRDPDDLYDYKKKRPFRDDPDFDPDDPDRDKFRGGGRAGFFKGAVAGGGNISPGTDTKGNVRDDNPFTGGGGGNNNNKPPTKKTLTTTQTKDDTKKNILKTIGGFAFNRFLNSMGVPTKDIQKAIAIKGILEQAGNVMFPEGDLQKIKATAPDQKTYNIEATKDMVENLPGGIVKDIFAPAGALAMSPFYDAGQAFTRMEPGSGIKGFAEAFAAEKPISSAIERFTGAAAPLAEKFEEGGIARIGLKDGMNRRTFLKLLTGAISIPIVGKFFKPAKIGKTVTKVPMIKTSDVPGKPEWFDSLVNKVILEGDDVTKNFATKDREIVHLKKIDDETTVRVTQDLDDDSIFVDIDDPVRNVMGEQGDTTLMMRYKKGQADETTKGKPADEFDMTEADMRNYMDGPDDYVTEFTDNTVTDMRDLTSDLTKIKSYATGKSPTMKEIAESKRRRDAVKFAEERPAEYAAERGPDVNYGDEDIELYTDYARGGLAGMLGE